GLQNISNNFVSGLILLVERPVRVEDWVTIDDTEGAITRIGMRSLTLTTWDNQDVIIPNANLISNPFTNWTLSDKLVRTVFVVGIRYQDDPHKAQSVIKDAVTMQPEVSLEREPRVLLTEFNASSVDFRVEYYVDVEQFSRLAVKSKVMFAIWDALKEADIGIPFPQRDIYIKELPAMSGSGRRAEETGSPATRPQAG
ncbi:MAG TPA: mechanosensitive ion channel, partial [Chromatiales bacterium]|nr:mechanosensitive ion channel [Chromatiales bacterium]